MLHGAMRCYPLTTQATCLSKVGSDLSNVYERVEAFLHSCNRPQLLGDSPRRDQLILAEDCRTAKVFAPLPPCISGSGYQSCAGLGCHRENFL